MTQQPTPETARPLSVTTVVMTRNRRDHVLRTLGHLSGPVVVVDNGSDDRTADAIAALGRPDVTVIPLPRNEGAVARNVGVRASRTPVVAFADDDSWWAPGALDRAARLFAAHPRLGLVAARLLVGTDERVDPICDAMASAPLGSSADLPGVDVLGFVACGAIVRRDAFLGCGGFDAVVYFPGEEERLALDLATAGWGLVYVDDVVAHHHPSPAADDGGERQALIARNHLLTAVMRRPWRVVVRRLEGSWSAGDPGRRGALAALPRCARALVRRRRVPGWVEQRARRLEALASAGAHASARLP
jgi:GT2 family glycosyltransferase